MKFFLCLVILAWSLVGCGDCHWTGTCSRDKDTSTSPIEVKPANGQVDLADDSTLTNLGEILDFLNIDRVHRSGATGQGVTIAVLDNGFAGLAKSLGRRLPPNLRVEYAPKNQPANEVHGTKMAELVHAVATGSVVYDPALPGPNILLFNTNGFTNLEDAVDKVIERDVDIVLYAQIWEYGGNRDGQGFINTLVNRAIDAGVLWVNAVGNYGRATYSGKIEIDNQRNVKLPFNNKYARLHLEETTRIKATLGWDDFTNSKTHRTTQNLDLELLNARGHKQSESVNIQGSEVDPNAEQASAHAREVIVTDLAAGDYLLKVKAKSDNFRPDSKMWLAVNGPNIEMMDKGTNNSVFIPADNPNVLSVGASDVNFSSSRSTDLGPAKPELVTMSTVHFDNGQIYSGTSAASAIAVGALAALSSTKLGQMNRARVLELLSTGVISKGTHKTPPDRPDPPILSLP